MIHSLLQPQPQHPESKYVVLLKKLPCPAHQPLYIEISTSSTIRDAFRDIEATFDGIENIPMRGFRWVEVAAKASSPSKP